MSAFRVLSVLLGVMAFGAACGSTGAAIGDGAGDDDGTRHERNSSSSSSGS
jgi:hypothetical protein